jgi:hypothetical protein
MTIYNRFRFHRTLRFKLQLVFEVDSVSFQFASFDGVMNCDARRSELRGFGDDLWKLGLLRYSTRKLQYSRYCSRGEA